MITSRIVIISLILIISLSIWTIYAEHFVGSINSISPPPGAIFLFFFIILVNSLLRYMKIGLRESELIALYSLLLVSAPISSFSIIRILVSILPAPFYFATPENEFSTLFNGIIPTWFAPREPSVVRGYYEPLGRGVPWIAWLKPLAVWISFALVAYILIMCMSIIIHRQWIDRERLTFPTVYLPLRLAEKPATGSIFSPLLKNKFLWIGFAIPVILHGINGLSFYHPVVPNLPLKSNFTRYLVDRPWNAVDTIPVNFYPNVIGFTYLLPVEISFSCWFFYLLSKAGMIMGSAFGWRTTSAGGESFPFAHHQSAGAFMALMLFNLWFGRRHIVAVFSKAFGIRNSADESEGRLYRFAIIGFIISLSVLVIWFLYVGMNPLVIIGFLALFLIYSLSAGRVRTEAGLGAVSGPIRMDDLLRSTIGTKRMGTESLVMLAYMRWMTTDLRGFMSAVPANLESFKMVGKTSKSLNKMPILIISGVMLAFVTSCISLLWVSYKNGVYTNGVNGSWIVGRPRDTFGILKHSLLNMQGTEWTGVESISFGFAISCLLAYLRTKFLWFPFHPIGYAVGFSRLSMDWVWFSVLIAWAIKLAVMKYGGIRLNRKLVPFCLGLVLGDFFMAAFWSIMGAIDGRIVYQIFP